MGVAYGPKKRMLAVIDRYRNTGVIQVDMPLPSAPPAYTDLVSEVSCPKTLRNSHSLGESHPEPGSQSGNVQEHSRVHSVSGLGSNRSIGTG